MEPSLPLSTACGDHTSYTARLVAKWRACRTGVRQEDTVHRRQGKDPQEWEENNKNSFLSMKIWFQKVNKIYFLKHNFVIHLNPTYTLFPNSRFSKGNQYKDNLGHS